MAEKATDAKKAPAEKKTAAKKTPAVKKTAAKKAPAEKKVAAAKAPAEKKTAAKKTEKKAEPVIKTILQIDGRDLDVSTVAVDALKKYKSTHKRKAVSEFVVYVKPEDNAAYYTVNGEGQDDFKIDL